MKYILTVFCAFILSTSLSAQRLPLCGYSNLNHSMHDALVRIRAVNDTFSCVAHDSIYRFTRIEVLDDILCNEEIYLRNNNLVRPFVALEFDSAVTFKVIDHVLMELRYEMILFIAFVGKDIAGTTAGFFTTTPSIPYGIEFSAKYYGNRYLKGGDQTCLDKLFPKDNKDEETPPPPPPPPPPNLRSFEPIGEYIKKSKGQSSQDVSLIIVDGKEYNMGGEKISLEELKQKVTNSSTAFLIRFSDQTTVADMMRIFSIVFASQAHFRWLSKTEWNYIESSVK